MNSRFKIQDSKFKKLATRYSLLVTFMQFTVYCSLLTLFGCGYAIQTRDDLPFGMLSIGKIENKTLEPKLQDRFSRQLAETFSEYGFRISSSAPYMLEGEITKFELEPLVEQNLTATQYRVIIKAYFRLIDVSNRKTISLAEESPFITYFSSAEKLQNVLALKELSTNSALKDISQAVVRRIIYNKQLLGGSQPSPEY